MKKLGKRTNEARETIEAYMPPCGYCYCYCETLDIRYDERRIDLADLSYFV